MPHRCESRPARLLCAIHYHHHRANRARARIGLHRIGYRWVAEAHPARRPRLLTYWARVHRRSLERLRAYEAALLASPVFVIESVFGSTAPAAISEARCESGLDPRAQNPSGASGLFQLMPEWWQGLDPFDPWTNARIAYRLSKGGTDWSQWVCKP